MHVTISDRNENFTNSHTVIVNCHIHRVSKNVPPLSCYNFDTHELILIFFGSNVTDEVGNQKTLYYAISRK